MNPATAAQTAFESTADGQVTAARPAPQPKIRRGWVLGLTSAAYFMVVLDALVVITALPRMQLDLHVGLTALQWTVNAYGIAFAAGIITAAALGDRLGRRRVFITGVALFTLASAACAVDPSVSSTAGWPAWPSPSARWSAGRSPKGSTGTGSSGSTSRSGWP